MVNKLLLCLGLGLLMLSFSKRPAPVTPPKDIWAWNIPDTTANEMIKHVKSCKGKKCRNFVNFKADEELVTAIYEAFQVDDATNPATWVTVRFRPADVAKYRARHSIPDSIDADVTGYTTRLLRVQKKDAPPQEVSYAGYAATYFYFDVGLICPPPDGACRSTIR